MLSIVSVVLGEVFEEIFIKFVNQESINIEKNTTITQINLFKIEKFLSLKYEFPSPTKNKTGNVQSAKLHIINAQDKKLQLDEA